MNWVRGSIFQPSKPLGLLATLSIQILGAKQLRYFTHRLWGIPQNPHVQRPAKVRKTPILLDFPHGMGLAKAYWLGELYSDPIFMQTNLF